LYSFTVLLFTWCNTPLDTSISVMFGESVLLGYRTVFVGKGTLTY